MIQWQVISVIQVLTILLTTIFWFSGFRLDIDSEQAETFGGILTTLVLASGLLGIFKARSGMVPFPILLFMVLPASFSVVLNLPTRTIFGYHAIALASHLLVMRLQYRAARQEGPTGSEPE
ncbi:hypothetical protein SCOR_14525 [Sulfidibacter corallicola]|uniref:Uncharacterized protein n=1 Tax=Sulfidibacter corallicola TaxID=2818388 RepID=A0A8A4TYI5_SULCO|nr:hypothetical protein [Sulfidibacter corallicola]QTD54321.1 hypothetical protein J3U87_17895 [Sulfidibacter corallicola]